MLRIRCQENLVAMERFTGISVFVEVADAGGFSAAAARLNLTRSAVGKTVSRLEQRLGVRLFNRTTRTQNLTEEGQLFYESCQKALGEIKTAESLLESGRREIRGRLRISMPVLFGRQCVAPLLRDLLQAHPHLEFDLSFNDRVIDLLDEGFDLAVRNAPLGNGAGLMNLAALAGAILFWLAAWALNQWLVQKRFASNVANNAAHLAVPLLFGITILVLWEGIVRGFAVPSVLLPAPSMIWLRLINSLPTLAADFRQTFLKSVLTGYALGCGLGFIVAILIDRSPFLQKGLLPLGNFVSALPVIGVAPIMVSICRSRDPASASASSETAISRWASPYAR